MQLWKILRSVLIFTIGAICGCLVSIDTMDYARISQKVNGLFRSDKYLTSVQDVKNVGLRWLSVRPNHVSNSCTTSMLKRIYGFVRGNSEACRNELIYSWPEGILAKGLAIADECSSDVNTFRVLEQYGERYISEKVTDSGHLRFQNIDDAANGDVFIYLYNKTRLPKYKAALDDFADYILRSSEEYKKTIAYRPLLEPNMRLVDTVAFICPFLIKYGVLFNNRNAIDLAVAQLSEFIYYGVDAKSGLPFHSYDLESHGSPVGLIGWGRGCGWLAIAVADVLNSLPEEYSERAKIKEFARAYANTLIKYQRKDGGWGSLLGGSNSRFDSSGTASITYFLIRASPYFVQDTSFHQKLERSIALGRSKLISSVNINGEIDSAQGNCIGLDNMSQRYGPELYSQGMAIAVLCNNLWTKDK